MLRFHQLAVFGFASAIVLATHPEPFTRWGIWALFPVLAPLFVSLLRTPGATTATIVAGVYAVLFGLAAGLGDESYTDVAQLVYLVLPALGLLAVGTFWIVRVAIAAFWLWRRPLLESDPSRSVPPRVTLGAVTGFLAGWSLLAATGWAGPKVVVAKAGDGSPPLVARARCEGNDTYVDTPAVRTQRDGVHVLARNESAHSVELRYEVDGAFGGGGGQDLPPGSSTIVLQFAAETVGLACVDGRPDASTFATVQIQDPEKIARAPEPDCVGDAEFRRITGRATRDVVGAARGVLRESDLLQRRDRVTRAVAIAGEFPVVVLVRDGRSIASVSFSPTRQPSRFVPTDLSFCRRS